MHLTLTREIFNPTCTIGKLYIDGVFFAHTLEDTCRDLHGDCSRKVQNATCIDTGSYEVVVNHSNHFNKELPEILNVPCFEGIRIHGGNTDKDTEGCILIGAETNGIDEIHNCALLVAEITERIKAAQDCTIDIESSIVA